MTQQQLLLADKILRLMATENKVWGRDIFMENLVRTKQFTHHDLIFVTERLVADGFTVFHLFSKTDYVITYKGERAAKVGLQKFYHEREDAERNDERRSKNSYILLIISVVLSVIGLVISLLTL